MTRAIVLAMAVLGAAVSTYNTGPAPNAADLNGPTLVGEGSAISSGPGAHSADKPHARSANDAFVGCFGGPDVAAGLECKSYDRNGDDRVDLRDVAILQLAYQGPIPPAAAPIPQRWRLQRAEPPGAAPLDPGAPGINVAAVAALSPPIQADLEPTIDVQITQEIIDKATELGTVEAMYEFVRNECQFQAYYGSQKGSVETLRQRAGNDYDLASLLIALLRASDIPARYAVGLVDMPVDRATSWLAVEDGQVAGSILYTNGMEGTSIVSGSEVVAVQARRVWVEAYVPRGHGSPTWVPLDPAFTQTTVHEGIDIPEEMAFDAQGFVDEYYDPSDPTVTLPRAETVLELFEQELAAYIAGAYPDLTLADAMRTHENAQERLGVLPASLPYTVRSRDAEFSEIPAAQRYQIRFHLYDGGTNLIDHTLNLPDIAGKRVTIDYIAATATDQSIIDAAGGLYYVPNAQIASVDLKPVIRVNGTDIVTSTASVGMGYVHESDIHFLAPSNAAGWPHNRVPQINNVITCGASQAIGFAVEGASEAMLNPPPDDDTEGMASLLYDTAMDYLAQCRNADLELGRLMHGYVTTGVTDAIVENVVNVTYDIWGNPQSFEWVALRVDADRAVLGYWPVERYVSDDPEGKDFMVIGGAEGSLNESRIYEDGYGQDSVSTIKILQLASDAGVTIYHRWSSTSLPTNTHSSSVRSALQACISSGKVATFPADPMTFGDPETGEWSGTGWICMDPTSGAAGYIISGNNNGGATVDWWPPQFVDLSSGSRSVDRVEVVIDEPENDSPDGDAIFPRVRDGLFGRTSDKITFKYRIHVFYDDGTDKWLPEPILGITRHYKRKTHYTAREFLPGHYMFKVWVSRWWWWASSGWSAERKVSIVGVFVRGDDGSTYGKKPPEYLPVKPDSGPTPSEAFKAVIIPDDLSGAYEWTTDSGLFTGDRLSIKSPSSQTTDVEPAGEDSSTSFEGDELDVSFTPSGGPECLTDEPHKMTVLDVELITPAGDPVTAPDASGDGQNEFTFSTATPGVLTIDFKAQTTPASADILNEIKGDIVFTSDSIGSSTMTWDSANPGGKASIDGSNLVASLKFSSLPASNSDFGAKSAAVAWRGTPQDEVTIEVFFPRDATNNPVLGPGTNPNWFYYWQSGAVCGITGDVQYDNQPGLFGFYVQGENHINIGNLAATRNTGPETYTGDAGTTYGSITVTGTGVGPHCCAETIGHELRHKHYHETWNTLINGAEADGETNGDDYDDPDDDGIPNIRESGYDGVTSDPNDPDTYNMGGGYSGYGDNEVRCRNRELNHGITVDVSADWANPGTNSEPPYNP